jgi:hypothetical protein
LRIAFPVAQWLVRHSRAGIDAGLAAYSCGGSRGIGSNPVPRSLLIPEGNRRRLSKDKMTHRSTPVGEELFSSVAKSQRWQSEFNRRALSKR